MVSGLGEVYLYIEHLTALIICLYCMLSVLWKVLVYFVHHIYIWGTFPCLPLTNLVFLQFKDFDWTRPRAGLRPAGPRWIIGRVQFSWAHCSRLALRLQRSARKGEIQIQKSYLCSKSKNVMSLTGAPKDLSAKMSRHSRGTPNDLSARRSYHSRGALNYLSAKTSRHSRGAQNELLDV